MSSLKHDTVQWRKLGAKFGDDFCRPLKLRNLGGWRETHCILELNGNLLANCMV